MKKLFDLFLKNLYLFILAYSGYLVYDEFNLINQQIEELQNQKNELEGNTHKLMVKNKNAIEFKKNIENSEARIEDIKIQIEEVQKQLPTTVSDTEVLDLFSREANGLNIKNVKLQPLQEVEKDFYFSKQFQLKGEGTFLQFLIFFETIANQERIYNVKSLTLKKATEKSKGRFQMLSAETVMESFRYNPSRSKKMMEDMDKEFAEKNKKGNKDKMGVPAKTVNQKNEMDE